MGIITLGTGSYILNVQPSLPDPRNWLFSPVGPVEVADFIDLRPFCGPIYDQGQLGSCTGNAQAGLLQFMQKSQKYMDFIPSRLFIYYWSRYFEGTVMTDSGATVADS